MAALPAFCAVPVAWAKTAPAVKDTWQNIYAWVGDVVTCENGHPICVFMKTVKVGALQDPANQLGHWQQPEPKIGQYPIPGCARCGAPFTNGSFYHIGDSWRDPSGHLFKQLNPLV